MVRKELWCKDSMAKKYKKYREKQKKLVKLALSKHYDTLTLAEKNSARIQLMIKQAGCCAICGQPEKELKRKLVLDHCHITGHIRGLLCMHCNIFIGFAKDNVYRLRAAVGYLSRERTYM